MERHGDGAVIDQVIGGRAVLVEEVFEDIANHLGLTHGEPVGLGDMAQPVGGGERAAPAHAHRQDRGHQLRDEGAGGGGNDP